MPPGDRLFGDDATAALLDAIGRHHLRARVIRVEITAGPGAGTSADLPAPSARIGSAADCDLVIADPTVSRHHLTLTVDEHGVRVIDAGSRNGTYVDGVRVFDACARTDSSITLGRTTLRLRATGEVVDVPLSPHDRFGKLRGTSTAMRRLFALLERIAATGATLLLEGETGTGKDLAAEAVHEASARSSGPYVVFDCSAVSAGLIESELFGHVRGAFTGAAGDRAGAFETATGGTLFLDEVGELPLELQPKLLRALESRDIRRVGSNERRDVDVRVIAATNRSLALEVERGRFREDLYYRLAVVRLELPPLRERLDDIPLLVRHFAGERDAPAAALEAFAAQSWPGNVRELRNAVERVVSLGIAPAPVARDAPAPAAAPAIDLSRPLREARDARGEAFERAYLAAALARTGGNATRAAQLAGVSRKFVQRAIQRYGLRDRRE